MLEVVHEDLGARVVSHLVADVRLEILDLQKNPRVPNDEVQELVGQRRLCNQVGLVLVVLDHLEADDGSNDLLRTAVDDKLA